MKHFDTFTGYGGFTISAQKLGWETIGFSEIDKYASAVLKYNFSNIKNYGDISDIDFRQFRGEIDIITGGTPCQDLSVAGKGKGLEGERSGLFFEFIRAVTESEATYFVWENVKGALSSSKGWDFARVQIEMEQAGYDVWWQVINAKDFGVPQNRERIFAIGIRKGSGREILFERRESEQDTGKVQGVKRVPLRFLSRNQKEIEGDYAYTVDSTNTGGVAIPNSNGNVHSLDANYWKGSNNPNKGRRSQIIVPRKRRTEYSVQDESSTITSRYRGAPDGDGRPALLEDMRIRRLTPTECERLMGLEDGWTSKGIIDSEEVDISDTQRYKMCGNGVVVNCVDYIYKLLS